MASTSPISEPNSEGKNVETFQEDSHGKQVSQMVLKGKGGGGDGNADTDDFDVWMKSRQLIKPDDQLELTEAELGEEISKALTPQITNVIQNLVVYSFKEGAFVPLPLPGNTVNLMSLEGTALLIDSEEAKWQIEESGEIGHPLPQPRYSMVERDEEETVDEGEADEEGGKSKVAQTTEAMDDEEEGEEEEEAEDEAKDEVAEGQEEEAEKVQPETPAVVAAPSRRRKLINQFNFCERAALTFTNPRRNVDTQTIPPPRSQYGANVLQWIIYDNYAEDYDQQHNVKEKKSDDRKGLQRKTGARRKLNKAALIQVVNRKFQKCWQILERMVNQNIYEDIGNDYRYWDDPADEFRENEGTLLPLWKFSYDRTKKMSVTDMMFNPEYYDLFAVCFGSHDFTRQPPEGSLCLFTVKNPSYPDYIIMTESSVMCCDIHPKYPFLVALGMYDGNVAVYNIKEYQLKPLYLSVGVKAKHAGCVNEIKWGPDMADGEINFYSVSFDGCVFNWVLMQNKFALTNIISLYLEDGIAQGPDGTEVRLQSCGCCMKFHPSREEIFLIGTEEGLIYKCNTAYSSKYLMTYNAHNLSVYRMDFNRFNSNIFISCSGDWRVKIWEDLRREPLFIFDLGSAVGDVKWAPFSSTVFAAATTEGKVYVYDLNVSKYRPICVQAVVPKRKNKLTRLSFNEKLPFIIVGDDKGTVTSLKLSPNLRLMVKPPKKQLYLDQNTLQIQKLEKLLSVVREVQPGAYAERMTTVAT